MISVCYGDGSTFWLERQKTAIMSDSMSDFFFLSEKGEIHMALVGNQLTGECSITYPSHPGFVLYTALVDGKKNGNCVLENEQGFIVLECSVHDDVVDGRVVHYTPQGVLLETGYLMNGKRDGSFFVFDEQRNIAEIHRFKNDEFVSVLHQCSSLKDYWEERSKATNEVMCVAKYTPDFSSMDGLCYMYEEGRVKRGEWYSEGRMVRMMMEFDEKVRTEFGEGGEKCFVGEYKNDVESGFCKEGKGCVLKGGKVVEVNVYENGKKKRKWRVIGGNEMTEFDENGDVVYIGGFAEYMEGFCPRNGRGKVYKNKQLKCIGVFEMDELKVKEKEFEKGLMTEYENGERVYWGGYMKDEKGEYVRNGKGNLYEDGRAEHGCNYLKGEEYIIMERSIRSDTEMEKYSRREAKRHEGDDLLENVNEFGDHSEVRIDITKAVKKERYMADNRAVDISFSFYAVSVLLALAMAICASTYPAVVPYIMGASVVVEIAFMVYQHRTMFSDAAYYVNSITSMLVLLFAFCIAFYQVTNTVYFAFSIVLGVGVIALVVLVIVDSKEKVTNCGAVFLIISLFLFIGCSAITIPSIKSPPMLSYVLLGLWIVSVILTNALNDDCECLFTHYVIPLVFTIMLVLVSIVFSKMNWVFFVTVAVIGVLLVVLSFGICINDDFKPIIHYSFFAFDLGLFTWWCWLTLSSHSMSILSFFIFICFYGMSVGLCFSFDNEKNEWGFVIHIIIVVCIMGCTCVFTAIDNTVLVIVFIVLNCILFVFVAVGYSEFDSRSSYEKEYAYILYVIEAIALVAWLCLCIWWIHTTKKNQTAAPALLFMILSVIISLTPLIIGIAVFIGDDWLSVLPVLPNVVVFGVCWYAVRYSSQFIPFVWFYGVVFGGAVSFVLIVLFCECCCC